MSVVTGALRGMLREGQGWASGSYLLNIAVWFLRERPVNLSLQRRAGSLSTGWVGQRR